MKKLDTIKQILATAKNITPHYWIEFTIKDGKIVIMDGRKFYDTGVTLLSFFTYKYKDVTQVNEIIKSVTADEIIQEYEQHGINHEATKTILKEIGCCCKEHLK